MGHASFYFLSRNGPPCLSKRNVAVRAVALFKEKRKAYSLSLILNAQVRGPISFPFFQALHNLYSMYSILRLHGVLRAIYEFQSLYIKQGPVHRIIDDRIEN